MSSSVPGECIDLVRCDVRSMRYELIGHSSFRAKGCVGCQNNIHNTVNCAAVSEKEKKNIETQEKIFEKGLLPLLNLSSQINEKRSM